MEEMHMTEKRGSLNSRRRRRGSAVLELAIAVPVVILLFAGAADFARVFRDAVSMTDSSHAGAMWGSLVVAHSRSFAEIQNVATSSAGEVNGSETAAENYCDCPDAPAKGPSDSNAVSCSTGFCPGYGNPRSYVRCRVSASFDPVLPYPGVPSDSEVGRWVYMRAQ
jgi:hypothetical protein